MLGPQYVHLRERWHVHGADGGGRVVVEARCLHVAACSGVAERDGGV
jgi:hypothetical protein